MTLIFSHQQEIAGADAGMAHSVTGLLCGRTGRIAQPLFPALLLILLSLLSPADLRGEDTSGPVVFDESKYQLPDTEFAIPAWVGTREDEPFDVRAFLNDRTVPAENAAPYYLDAFSQFVDDFHYLHPRDQQNAFRDRCRSLEGELTQLTELTWLSGNSGSDAVRELVQRTKPFLRLIDEAQKRPACRFLSPQNSSSVPLTSACSRLMKMSSLVIAEACQRSDFRTADHAVIRMLRLSRDLRPSGSFSTLCYPRIIADSLATDLLLFYLSRPDLKQEDLDRLIRILQDHDRLALMMNGNAFQICYIDSASTLAELQSGKMSRDSVLAFTNLTWQPTRCLDFELEWKELNAMYKPHVTATGRLPDLVKLDDLQNAVCKEWKQQCDRQEKSLWNCLLMWLGVKKYPAPTVISELLFKPQLQLHFMDAFERTRIRGIIAFAAVRRYQIGHQANPARLLDAVQEAGLQEIPPDPYDGQPLRYIQRNGRPTVYAIGPDLTDNGGLYDFRFESRRPADNLFQLHDLIYDPNHPGLALPEPDEPEGPGM